MRLVFLLSLLLPLHYDMVCASHGACYLVVSRVLAAEPVVMATRHAAA